ncbi:MAG: FAD-dependent oxidoreductase [Geminicoccaceae bacterium]|jgi:L-aspartate oxidase|nr:FAD-dependent oxidoreductase [Solirubrobacterales bacterium]MCE3246372.1 FAD-dependent oxidoreductase [Geminicoccaceae bacterium]
MRAEIVIVGGGAAGLHVALEAAEAGTGVLLVSRKPLSESSSFWAQGGLAAALAADDSPDRHAADTLAAGRGLCRTSAVEVLTGSAPDAIERLQVRGVRFDAEPDGELALGLEGGHSARRIVHAGGSETGRVITSRLAELVAADERIEVLEGASATALWSDGSRCAGVVTDRGAIVARATVLSTGGGAALWARTTNPWGAIGAGSVLAHAGGAELADLELCQFHPTALALPGSEHDGALITEAVRGEGARLLDASGERFTDELAPRDQVTAAILDRIEADRTAQVWLDLRGLDPERFPNVFEVSRRAGLAPDSAPVPIAPAAHYLIGGVACDLDGRTTLRGLFAVGECACTGLHGANRLASNSLTECFVFGSRAARAAVDEPDRGDPPELPAWRFVPPTAATRAAVWRGAGPRRERDRLEALRDDPYPLARLIARSALARRESRGAHLRTDFPLPDPALDGVHVCVDPADELRLDRWI